jgi:hypothetical protein
MMSSRFFRVSGTALSKRKKVTGKQALAAAVEEEKVTGKELAAAVKEER